MVTIAEGYSRDKRGAINLPARPLRIARKAFFILVFISAGIIIVAGLMLDRALGKKASGTGLETGDKERQEAR